MAQIQTETVAITFNRLIKDSDKLGATISVTSETLAALEQVAQELVGETVVVEVVQA